MPASFYAALKRIAGAVQATRYARGHKALFTLEINGERASAAWDLHDLHRLNYFDHNDQGQVRGWRNVHITDGDHPYMKTGGFRDFRSDMNTPSFIRSPISWSPWMVIEPRPQRSATDWPPTT